MQPMCRQVPPRKGSCPTTTVFSPRSPARIAATYPPGPLPIIATSYFATRSLPSAGARTGEWNFYPPESHSIDARGGQADKTGRQSFVLRVPCQTFVLRAPSQTEKKPPALTAQTAASQQTSNFNSRWPPSQPRPPRLLRPASCACPGWIGARRRRCSELRVLPRLRNGHRDCTSTNYIIMINIKISLAFLLTQT